MVALLALVLSGGCGGASNSSRTPAPQSTLYTRLGGIDALRDLVDEWILQASTSEAIRDRFAGADIANLKRHLLSRVCLVAEGPCTYEGRDLHQAHAALKLGQREVEAFFVAFDSAAREVGFPAAETAELRGRLVEVATESAMVVGP